MEHYRHVYLKIVVIAVHRIMIVLFVILLIQNKTLNVKEKIVTNLGEIV